MERDVLWWDSVLGLEGAGQGTLHGATEGAQRAPATMGWGGGRAPMNDRRKDEQDFSLWIRWIKRWRRGRN